MRIPDSGISYRQIGFELAKTQQVVYFVVARATLADTIGRDLALALPPAQSLRGEPEEFRRRTDLDISAQLEQISYYISRLLETA